METLKFVSWNIRHGGSKKKLEGICNQLEVWNPDVVGLSEFRESATSQSIAKHLHELGLKHQLTTVDAADRGLNFLLLASRYPLKVQPASGILASSGRWLHAKLNSMDVALVHVPNRSTAKWQFHAEVIARFNQLQDVPAICFGDTNTGQPELDEENPFFNRREADWFQKIDEAGWVDVWRQRNPQGRAFSWYSNHGNGFRLDQLFVSHTFADSISKVKYDWSSGGRDAKLSDHAAITFEILQNREGNDTVS